MIISWCRINFKLKRSRSLLIMKGKVAAIALSVVGQAIPLVMDEPFKGFSRVYDASLTDKNALQHIREMAGNGLVAIDRSRLIGKFNMLCVNLC